MLSWSHSIQIIVFLLYWVWVLSYKGMCVTTDNHIFAKVYPSPSHQGAEQGCVHANMFTILHCWWFICLHTKLQEIYFPDKLPLWCYFIGGGGGESPALA